MVGDGRPCLWHVSEALTTESLAQFVPNSDLIMKLNDLGAIAAWLPMLGMSNKGYLFVEYLACIKYHRAASVTRGLGIRSLGTRLRTSYLVLPPAEIQSDTMPCV